MNVVRCRVDPRLRRFKPGDRLRVKYLCGKTEGGSAGPREKLCLRIALAQKASAGWIGIPQKRRLGIVCESGNRIEICLMPVVRTKIFERGGHRRCTVGGARCWHVCDLIKLGLPRKSRAVDRSVDRLVRSFFLIILHGSMPDPSEDQE